MLADLEDLREHDLDVVGADASRQGGDAEALVLAGRARELAVAMRPLDGVEVGGDPLDAVLVPGEEDVIGQLTRAEPDVVLPFAGGDCDAGIRVWQGLAPVQRTLD